MTVYKWFPFTGSASLILICNLQYCRGRTVQSHLTILTLAAHFVISHHPSPCLRYSRIRFVFSCLFCALLQPHYLYEAILQRLFFWLIIIYLRCMYVCTWGTLTWDVHVYIYAFPELFILNLTNAILK